jgi:hypothetical protein
MRGGGRARQGGMIGGMKSEFSQFLSGSEIRKGGDTGSEGIASKGLIVTLARTYPKPAEL